MALSDWPRIPDWPETDRNSPGAAEAQAQLLLQLLMQAYVALLETIGDG